MGEGLLPKNNKKKRMSHFWPGLESEHCSKTGPANSVLLPGRQSGEKRSLNSHCSHPQPPFTTPNSPQGAGRSPSTCAEFALAALTKKKKMEQEKKKIKRGENEVSPVDLPDPPLQ